MMSVQTTLFGYKLNKKDHIYKDHQNKYKQIVECFYQCNRTAAIGKSKQELVKEAQVCPNYISATFKSRYDYQLLLP